MVITEIVGIGNFPNLYGNPSLTPFDHVIPRAI